jgi:phosphoserine aminotransferase
VVAEAERNIRALLDLPDGYHVLFLQGGATQQFFTLPLAFARPEAPPPQYLHTGYWSGKALAAATKHHRIDVAWSGQAAGFKSLPRARDLVLSADAPYFHYVTNETVDGVQFQETVGRDDVPRLCDMSSDFLSRSCEAARHDLIYAHAQKNLGPAGVTVVMVRDAMLGRLPDGLPDFMDYRTHVAAHSIYNTPPVFAIYAVLLATRWLRDEMGGLEGMEAVNRRKAGLLYSVIDDSDGYYRGRADAAHRSMMNVVFNMATPELEQRFLEESRQAGFTGLNGHRSVGGMRASLYNGVTLEATEALAGFMRDFRRRHAA